MGVIRTLKSITIRDYNLKSITIRLWENFLVSERLKQNHYKKRNAKTYFWRSKQQQEIDYVEELNGKIYGFEFKWNEKRKVNSSKTFTDQYEATNMGVTRGNFREFVLIS